MLNYYEINGRKYWVADGVKKEGNSLVFSGQCPVKVDFDIEPIEKTPQYRSWNGFYAWSDEIKVHFGLSTEKAHLALCLPNRDTRWAWLQPAEMFPQTLIQVLHPFKYNEEDIHRTVQLWFGHGYGERYLSNPDMSMSISPWSMIDNIEVIWLTKPKSFAAFKKAARYADLIAAEDKADYLPLYNRFELQKRAKEEVQSFAFFGKVEPTFLSLLREQKHGEGFFLQQMKAVREYFGKESILALNPNFLPENDEGFSCIEDYVRAGLSLKQIFSKRWPSLTKKEIALAYERYAGKMHLDIVDIADVKGIELPRYWFQYINSIPVLEWASAKKDQLAKSRTIYGPGGQQAEMHYHELLRSVTPDMLPQGPKTAFRNVMAALEEQQQARIQAQFGEEVRFKIPEQLTKTVKAFPEVTILDTNFKLRDEGKKMKHCVGSYVHSCIEGVSQILHLDTDQGSSTAEIGKRKGAKEWTVFQHYTVNDHAPQQKNREVAEKLLLRLNKK